MKIKISYITFLILLGFVSIKAESQTNLYSENFSTNNGKGQNGTTYDVSGVTNWSINVGAGLPFSAGDYFYVSGGQFYVQDADGVNEANPCWWTSAEVNIECYSNVTVSADLIVSTSGISSNYVRMYYSLDGAAYVPIGAAIAGSGSNATRSLSGLSGSTIQIKIAYWGTSSTGSMRHDNVSVVGTFSPATPASNLVLSNNTGSSIDLSWTNGSGDEVLVIAKENSGILSDPVSGNTYSANSVFGAGSEIGTGNFVVYTGSGTSLTVTGLNPGTDYDFAVYSYNTGFPCYNTNSVLESTLCSAPATQVSAASTSSVSYSSLTLSWTAGSGDMSLVVGKIDGTSHSDPVSNTLYTANSSFGAGSEIGTENFVLFSGAGSSVNITGLAPNTNYIFSIYSFNSADNCYNVSEITSSATTLNTSSYEIDVFNEAEIITCSGTFTDSNPAGNYSANEDNSISFCSPDGDLLKFSFSTGRIAPGDTLYLYNGPSTSSPLIQKITGNAANSNRLPYFEEASSFSFISPGSCITFQFVTNSDATTAAGWSAAISCYTPLSCGGNEPASDLFGGAPYVCNINGYCGITSGDFDSDVPADLNYTGGSCPSALNFLGTVENNSWIKFIADATTAEFDFEVPLGGTCLNGIQTAIFAYDGSSLTRMSDCSMSDGSHSGNFTLSATGLTIGETYYIMTDGNAGDICEYTINANTGVAVVYAGADQAICNGQSIELSTSGPPDGTYIWNSLDGLVVNAVGAVQTFSPVVTTTYIVEISGGGVCEAQTDTIVISVSDCLFPVEFSKLTAIQNNEEITVSWSTFSEKNNDYFTVQKSVNGRDFFDIADVEGAGNSSTIYNYSIIDKEPVKGINYYKIKQTDYNGDFTFSNIASVNFNSGFDNFNMYYSEDNNSIVFENLASNSKTDYSIYDVSGRKLAGGIINPEKCSHSVDVDFLVKNPTLILIKVNCSGNSFNKKILIK
ncbi:MAG: fibronectin type III domain-containing protein [Bacteroidales bacterium]|nr:fibronectin type III domain-containing protein [Bacteroidales bacterium]